MNMKTPTTGLAAGLLSAGTTIEGDEDAAASAAAEDAFGNGDAASCGSDGGTPPPGPEDGVELIRMGLTHVEQASSMISLGVGAIQDRMALLETQIAELRAAKDEPQSKSHSQALQKADNLRRGVERLEDEKRFLKGQNEELRTTAAEGERAKAREDELTEALETIAREAHLLRSANAAASNAVAGLLSLIETTKGHIEGAVEGVGRIPVEGEDAGNVDTIRGMLEGAISLLDSIRGETGQIEEATEAARAARVSSLPPGIEADLDQTATVVSSTAAPIPDAEELVMKRIFERVAWAFDDDGHMDAGEISNALVDAIRFSSESKAPAIINATSKALSTILNPNFAPPTIRGFVSEALRLSSLAKGGREFNEYSMAIPAIEFNGWRYDKNRRQFVRRKLFSKGEIDAIEGNTFIEIKGMWLGGMLGKYLSQMLMATEHTQTVFIDSQTFFGQSNGFDQKVEAASLMNQLVRYKRLIDAEAGKRLELHVTSRDPVPDNLVTAIHTFFGEGRVEVVWYDNILVAKGTTLDPQLVLDIEATPSTDPTATGGANEAIVEGLPEPFEAGDDTTGIPDGMVTEEEGESVELTIEIQADPTIEEDTMDDETMEAELAHLDDVTAAQQAIFASPDFMTAIEYNTSGLNDFIEWIVREGHWAGTLVSMDPEGILGAATTLHSSWAAERIAEARREAALNAPWNSIEDKNAQNAFNTILKNQEPTRTIAIDWRHRVAQSIFNEHVTGALAEIQDTELVKGDQELSNRIGEFIEYLRGRYGPRSYFKITEDGPELITMMKQYLWLRSGSG